MPLRLGRIPKGEEHRQPDGEDDAGEQREGDHVGSEQRLGAKGLLEQHAEETRVRQPAELVVGRYSLTCQNVVPSVGSTA